MYDIIKEKNLLKFVLDEKTYCLDLNTGNLLGLRGFPLKSTPRDLEDCLRENYDKNTISTALWYFYWCQDIPFHKMTSILSEIQMFDTLDSIGYRLNYDELSLPRIRFVQEHLKEFSKAFKEDSEINFVSFFQEYYVLLKCKEYNIVIDDHFTTAMARSLIDNANTFLPWQIKWVKYYMQKGLYTLLEDRLYIMYGKMQEYFRYCDYLHIEPIKTDFLRAYLEVKNTYLTNKTKYDDEALKQNQERYKKSLFFENENFVTIIPITKKEFEDEATEQNNCVARFYLPKVIDGKTNIVFIRKKDNIGKSFITCEVVNGRIMQFLKSYNTTPSDNESIDFYKQYQEHLTKNWE